MAVRQRAKINNTVILYQNKRGNQYENHKS